MIKQELENWKMEAGATRPIMYHVNHYKGEITICTSQPGWLIGAGGCLFDKYTKILGDKLLLKKLEIIFVETNPEIV